MYVLLLNKLNIYVNVYMYVSIVYAYEICDQVWKHFYVYVDILNELILIYFDFNILHVIKLEL